MTWSGPNLPAGTTSVLNIQNINRNQTGNYQCTASNEVSSKTSVVVNVVVQCKFYVCECDYKWKQPLAISWREEVVFNEMKMMSVLY
jgi:hypothetical protein